MSKTNHYSSGFTLIEVLVAAVILFLVASTGLLAYNSALQTNQRVAARYEMMRPVTMIVDHIRQRLQGGEVRSGNGQIDSVKFNWRADVVEKSPPPPRFDPDEATFMKYNPRYELVRVTIKLRTGEYEHSVNYKEVAWLPKLTGSSDSP